ncbi:MAG: Mrp/NBP35 family ATP-binding protein [Oscillospiraceae bacterium]
MSENCTHNCDTCGESCSERSAPQDFREAPNVNSHIKKVIGVVSGKGGVGKSMTSAMLAILLNRLDYKTAILDADVTGPSIPRLFGLHERAMSDGEGIFPVKTKTGINVMSVNLLLENEADPVVWRGPVIAGTVKQFWQEVIWQEVDFMFVDMPPGTGDVPLTVFQSLPIDGIIVVTSPQELVQLIVEKAVNMAKMMNIPIVGLVENMSYLVCPDCGKEISVFGKSRAEETAAKYEIPLLAKLPIDSGLAALADKGSLELFEGDWLNVAASAVEKLLQL